MINWSIYEERDKNASILLGDTNGSGLIHAIYFVTTKQVNNVGYAGDE